MPNLALHQLRVAAVAKHLLEALKMRSHAVTSACLLHDMGNIIKFRLTDFPEFLEPEGAVYWEGVKAAMIEKYGPEEHIATARIAEEIGVSKETKACIEAVGFSKSIQNIAAPIEHRICAYSDLRVGPHGLLTLQERFEDGQRRYADRKDRPRAQLDHDQLMARYVAAFTIEQSIYDLADGKVELMNEDIEQTAETLRAWEIC